MSRDGLLGRSQKFQSECSLRVKAEGSAEVYDIMTCLKTKLLKLVGLGVVNFVHIQLHRVK